MKKLSALFSLLSLLVFSAPVLAADQDFTLVNQTGVEIYSVYVGPSSAANWGEDILEQETLENGASADITFAPNEDAELWDLKVEDGEGNTIEWTQLNLTEISVLTLHFKNGEPTAEIE